MHTISLCSKHNHTTLHMCNAASVVRERRGDLIRLMEWLIEVAFFFCFQVHRTRLTAEFEVVAFVCELAHGDGGEGRGTILVEIDGCIASGDLPFGGAKRGK